MALGKAVLVSFEGIDGSGKTTAIVAFTHYLAAQKIPAVFFREPGATALGERIRKILLAKKTSYSPDAELFLYLAARAQLCAEKIAPAMNTPQVIVLDRFFDSTIAYQGYGRGVPISFIKSAHKRIIGSFRPDITFLLDIPAERVRSVLRKRGADSFEQSLSFQKRVRRGYLAIAAQEPKRVRVIKRGTVEATFSRIRREWETYWYDSRKRGTFFP